MALTMLDPNTALIIVDLQQGIVRCPATPPIAVVVDRACALADAFRRRGLPVVLVNVAGVLLIALYSARHFGRFNGANPPDRP
jgi:hypothetical protein